MTSLNNIIFVDSLPSLDIHGYDRISAKVAINDYIEDKVKLKQEVFSIIHGNGRGILREATRETLTKNKKVLEFKQSYYNTGCTIVKIAI